MIITYNPLSLEYPGSRRYGGSFSLAKKIQNNFFVINLDGIGCGELELSIADGPFRSKTSKLLNKRIFKICKSLKLDIKKDWSYHYPIIC